MDRRRYIENLKFFSKVNGTEWTDVDLQGTIFELNDLLADSIDMFLDSSLLRKNPTCIDLPKYKALYLPGGKETIYDEEWNPLQKAVYYFLRVPGFIGFNSLSPIQEPSYSYFQGEEATEYVAFLRRWQADMDTKCTEYLTRALAQPLPSEMLLGMNDRRSIALREFHRASLDPTGNCNHKWITLLYENTTVYEFLMQLVELAYHVNQGNMFLKEIESMYDSYDGMFAAECRKMFRRYLLDSIARINRPRTRRYIN